MDRLRVRALFSAFVAAAAFSVSSIGAAQAAPARPSELSRASTASASIVDLGVSAGGWASRGAGLNDRGQVAGAILASPDSPDGTAAVWANGSWTKRGAGSAAAVAPGGETVGLTGSGAAFHAALWDTQGQLHDLGTLPGGLWSQATAANARGQVVGYAQSSLTHAFVWQSGRGMTDLGATSAGASYAYGINNTGLVVGSAAGQAVEWTAAGKLVNLGAGAGSVAYAINARGDVVGDTNNHAFVRSAAGSLSALPSTAGMTSSSAVAINTAGQIVGSAQITDGSGLPSFQAVLWQQNGVCRLTNLLPADSGWTLSEAVGINNRGQIVGNGVHDGQLRAFLLTVSGDLRGGC